MRFGAERAQRDAGRHQPLADFGDDFDLVDRDRRAAAAEIEQVAQMRSAAACAGRRHSGDSW